MSEQVQEEEGLAFAEVPYRISELAQELLNHPDPEVADRVTELLDWYDTFHREGLGRLVDLIRSWRGDSFLDDAGKDEMAGVLLEFYDFSEGPQVDDEAEQAVAAALEEVRPIVESHGGSLEVAGIADGVVKVRMLGTCDGCPSSSATLTYGVEEALRRHWPAFRRLEQMDPSTEIDEEKADLVCVTAPESSVPTPSEPLIQIRGHEGR
jgi:Fe-S cluster biogenesis protein NfuA